MTANEKFSKRTEITVERHSLTVIRCGAEPDQPLRCSRCGEEVADSALTMSSRKATADDQELRGNYEDKL